MSTTLTEVTEEEAVITRAQAALAAVRSDTFPWPSTGSSMIRHYAEWLADDLEARDDLLAGRRHPVSEFPELARWWPDDALGQAVAKVTQDIGAGTGALAEVVRKFCGDEVAALVSSEGEVA